MKRAVLLALLVLAVPAAAVAEERAVTLSEVLGWMSDGKKTFVYDQRAAAIWGQQGIRLSPENFEKARSYAVGVGLLKAAGLAVVPLDGATAGIVRIVPADRAPFEALRVYETAAALPEADEYCTLSLEYQHAAPTALYNIAQQVLRDNQRVVFDAEGRRIVLTGYASELRHVADVIARADVERTSTGWRVRIAVLEARIGGAASVPEEFRGLDLEKATGRNAFALAGDAISSLDTAPGKGGSRVELRGIVRFQGLPELQMDFEASPEDDRVTLERFLVREESNNPQQAGRILLAARPSVTDGKWALAGSLPGGPDGGLRIVVVRADKVR
ncbi:MAG: hypothetical protein HYY18_00270 [Planctomycetes bacterium]|nr:hypothetical protein [Planctomycetota bacterium]